MINVSVFLTRRPDLTHEQFSQCWRDKHAPLLMSLESLVGHTTGQSVGRTSTHRSQSRMAHSQGRNVAEWTSGKGERPEFWINLRNDVGLFSAHESGEHIGE
jgi:hypothetical protein